MNLGKGEFPRMTLRTWFELGYGGRGGYSRTSYVSLQNWDMGLGDIPWRSNVEPNLGLGFSWKSVLLKLTQVLL